MLPYGRPKYGIIDSCRVSHQAYDKNPKGRLKKYFQTALHLRRSPARRWFFAFLAPDRISQFRTFGTEVSEQGTDAGVVIGRKHDLTFALANYHGHQFVLRPIKGAIATCELPIRRGRTEEGVFAVAAFETLSHGSFSTYTSLRRCCSAFKRPAIGICEQKRPCTGRFCFYKKIRLISSFH